MIYTYQDLRNHPVWRHVKTGSLYHVLGIAVCSTNGEREHKEESVIYFSMDHQGLRYREINEFLDGRFTPVPVAEVPAAKEAKPPETEGVKYDFSGPEYDPKEYE